MVPLLHAHLLQPGHHNKPSETPTLPNPEAETPRLLAPEAQQAVLAAGGDRGAVGAPIDGEDLVRVAWQLQLQLSRGHIPHLSTAGFGFRV